MPNFIIKPVRVSDARVRAEISHYDEYQFPRMIAEDLGDARKQVRELLQKYVTLREAVEQRADRLRGQGKYMESIYLRKCLGAGDQEPVGISEADAGGESQEPPPPQCPNCKQLRERVRELEDEAIQMDRDINQVMNERTELGRRLENVQSWNRYYRAYFDLYNALREAVKEVLDGLRCGDWWSDLIGKLEDALAGSGGGSDGDTTSADYCVGERSGDDRPAALSDNRPEIICLCGSSKFVAEMAILAWEIEKTGKIAFGLHLLPENYCPNIHDHLAEHQRVAKIMDELHLRKIEISDKVWIVNKDGYIGESTRREIQYAEKLGKPITYLYDKSGGGETASGVSEAQISPRQEPGDDRPGA